MRRRIFFKLLLVFALVIAATVVIIDASVRSAWEKSLRQEIERNLTQKTVMFAHRVNIDRAHSLQDIAAQEGGDQGCQDEGGHVGSPFESFHVIAKIAFDFTNSIIESIHSILN